MVPVFYDKRANVKLYEILMPCSVELTFTMKVKSRELADIVTTALFEKTQFNYNEVIYSYSIPDRVLISLYKMFKLKDITDPSLNFKRYLELGSNDSIG